MVSGSLQVPIAASNEDAPDADSSHDPRRPDGKAREPRESTVSSARSNARDVAPPETRELAASQPPDVAAPEASDLVHAEARDFARLERAVKALVAAHATLSGDHADLVARHAQLEQQSVALRTANAALESKLDETMLHGRALEERLGAENLRRQDALKRVDDLIGRMGQLESATVERGTVRR